MVRQRFTALCKTAMVSSIVDSPSSLYKFLTMSLELFKIRLILQWSQKVHYFFFSTQIPLTGSKNYR